MSTFKSPLKSQIGMMGACQLTPPLREDAK